MHDLLKMKFSQCEKAREELLRLRREGHNFVEDSGRRKDYFWGMSNAEGGWRGDNRLGILLNEVADNFIEQISRGEEIAPIYEFRPEVLDKLKYRDARGDQVSLEQYDSTRATPPPPPPPPLAPPPAPPKKPPTKIKKTDFDRRFDAFNAVTDESWLTHQNVDSLMHDAFVKSGIEELEVTRLTSVGSIDICPIDNRSEALDHILRDAMLKFIGQEPPQPSASIALCSGGHRDPVTGAISGGSHWTALHLERVTDETTGLTTIRTFTMDSGGYPVPPLIARVSQMINDNHENIMAELDGDAQNNQVFQRADAVLRRGNLAITGDPAVLLSVRQTDPYSCGYHTVFNLLRMNFWAGLGEHGMINQASATGMKQVDINQFIADRKAELKQRFPAPSQERAVPPSIPDSRAAPKQDPKSEASLIVFDQSLSLVQKLEKLIDIEKRLMEAGDVIALSNLQIEKHYGRIISEIVGSLSKSSSEALPWLDTLLGDKKIFQDPKIILEPLKTFFSKTSITKDDFAELGRGINEKIDGADKEQTWKNRYEKLSEFLNRNQAILPESLDLLEQHSDITDATEEKFCELSKQLQSTIFLEQRKQKIFKDLDFVDSEHAKDEPNYRELKIGRMYYGLEKQDNGEIRLFQSSTDNDPNSFSKVDLTNIDRVLRQMEDEIISRKITRLQSDELVKEVDGSIIFAVKTLINASVVGEADKEPSNMSLGFNSPNQVSREKAARISKENAEAAEHSEKKWEVIGEKEGKIEMAKLVTLRKDDTMWELDGEKIKLVGELGTDKKTKFASEIMKYYLHDHVGTRVEETKKLYGVTSTVAKPNPIISELISAVRFQQVSEKGRGGSAGGGG
jgi:hypothetical protein